MQIHQRTQEWWDGLRANVYMERGKTHVLRDENERALKACSRAIRLNPTLIEAFNSRGRARYRLGDLAGAIDDFNAVLALDPRCAVAYLNRGLANYAQGEIDDALGDFNMAIYLDPKQAIAYNNRGLIDELQGNLNGAIADYTQAIRLNPRIITAYTNRGGARLNRGDLRGAIADYQRYLALGGGWRNGDQIPHRSADRLAQRALGAAVRSRITGKQGPIIHTSATLLLRNPVFALAAPQAEARSCCLPAPRIVHLTGKRLLPLVLDRPRSLGEDNYRLSREGQAE